MLPAIAGEGCVDAMVDIAVGQTTRLPRRDVPSVVSAALFQAKVALFRAHRLLRDALHSPPRLRPAQADDYRTLLAQSVTALWSDQRPEEAAAQQGKVQNLRRAAQALDGLGLPAGGEFSFWRAVGRASRRRGYVEGRMLQEGCLVLATGGGLCQLSNALFAVALEAGAEITERHPHSRIVPGSAGMAGRDATVAWNYVDLRFRSAEALRLEVRLTATELIVRLWGATRSPGRRRPRAGIIELPRRAAHSCASCSETACHRHERSRPATARTVFMLDEATSEFRGFVAARRQPGDVLAVPLDGDRWGKPSYGWATAGFAKVVTATGTTIRRGLALRHHAAEPGRRVEERLRRTASLANRLARALTPDATEVVVAQSLLPHLRQAGVLGGRRVTVLMAQLPMHELQARLDAAARRHPHDRSLVAYRAPASLVDAERAALAEAAEIVTPHTDIAALFPDRATLLAWRAPMPQRRMAAAGAERRIAFPGPALGRKGAATVRDVARMLDLEVVVVGSDLSSPGFWERVVMRTARGSDWLGQVCAVVQPAWIEDRPLVLLHGLSAGLPVIASPACGLPPQPGLTLIPADEPLALATALHKIVRPREPVHWPGIRNYP
jgi:hypothetical protein